MNSGTISQVCGAEPKYREFFAHLGEAAVIYEVDDESGDVRVVEMNCISAEMAGVDRDDAVGRRAGDVFGHVESGGFLDVVLRVGRTGRSERFVLKAIGEDGLDRWWDNTVFKVEAKQVATIYRETTRIRELEVNLQRAGRREALGTLAGGIAHEFNNILYAILGYANLAQEDLAGSPVVSNLDEIVLAGKRGSNLVQQLLAFSRRAGGERTLVNLAQTVKEIEVLLRSSLPAGVSLVLDLGSRHADVVVDVGQVQQLILNVCLNAFEAMEDSRGTVNIELKDVTAEFKERGHDHWVCLRIRDDGPGMEAAVLERAFIPFFTTNKPGSGTGLGLAAAVGIVEGHGGVARAASKPGEGATFDFYFPVDSERKTQCGRILFVDDEEMIARLGRAVLTRAGHEVDVFTDPQQALSAFARAPEEYTLVVTDQVMPQMSGREMAAEIRKICPSMRILMISGAEISVTDNEMKTLGIVGRILKPIDIHDLSRAVEAALADFEGVETCRE